MVSEYLKQAVPDVLYRRLDFVRVKGKLEPVWIYEPVGEAKEVSIATKAELEQHEAALDAYLGRDWDAAHAAFTELAKARPRRLLYRIYLQRVANYRRVPPPPEWDGVYVHTTK